MAYSFGVPNIAVWIQHILSGLLLLYIGYIGVTTGNISKLMSLLLVIFGVLAATYHAHLWYYNSKKKKKVKKKNLDNEYL